MQSIFRLAVVLLALISTIQACKLTNPECITCYARCLALIDYPTIYAACIATCSNTSPGPSVDEQFIENLDSKTLKTLIEKHKSFEKKAQAKLAKGEL